MKPYQYVLVAATLASAASAAPVAHRYAIGGVPAERTSVTFVDLANLQRTGEAVRAPMLLVQRDVRNVGGKLVLYSGIDTVFDCKAKTISFAEVKTFGPDGALVDDISTPGPKLPLAPGSSFAASAEVACTGQPRAVDAPNFATEKLAVDYAQRLLHDQRPNDRAL